MALLGECSHCRKPFRKRRSSTKYCCRSCQSKALAPFNRKKRQGVTKQCSVCGNPFYVPSYRQQTAIYCSRSCLAKVHLAQFSEYRLKPTGKPPHTYKTMKVKSGTVRIHRWLMEQHLGRKLSPDEHVHHINGNSLDNRLSNLEVLTNSEHQKLELRLRGHTKQD